MASTNPYLDSRSHVSSQQTSSPTFSAVDVYGRSPGTGPGGQDDLSLKDAWPQFPQSRANAGSGPSPGLWTDAPPTSGSAGQRQHPHHQAGFNHSTSYSQDVPFSAFGSTSHLSTNADATTSVGPSPSAQALSSNVSSAVMPLQPVTTQVNGASSAANQSQHGYMQLPKGSATGQFLILSSDNIKPLSATRQMKPFLRVAQAPIEIPITRATIPAFYPRKSRNEIKTLMKQNPNLKAQVSKKISKKSGLSKSGAPRVKLEAPSTHDAKRRLSHSSSEASSDESDDASSDDELEDPSPLPAKRPETSTGATEYDTIKALWHPRTRALGGEDIRTGLKTFSEVVSTVRERFKKDLAAAKAAEEARNLSELPMLKERVAKQREMLEVALRAANKHGHPDILTHCGEHLAMMNGLALSLQDRVKDADYNGPLSKAILEFLTRCTALTEANMEKTKLSKVVPRFVARGETDVKALARRIQENAAAATKKKKETIKAPVPSRQNDTKASNGDTEAKSVTPALAGAKRSISDSSAGSPAKKQAVSSSAAPAKSTGESQQASAPKPKVVPAAPATTSFFSALKSASKRSAAPATAKETVPKAAVSVSSSTSLSTTSAEPRKPAPASKPAAAPAPALGGFAATLAGVKKAQEPERPAVKAREKSPPTENAEQKAKRIRKEKRRKLRVTWKPETELVQVRLFHHDPEEELGHDASQIRDVNDINSEGRMFKMKAQMESAMDVDSSDDEDDEAVQARFAADYPDLRPIDFSAIDQEEREQRLFMPFGGGMQEPDSKERQLQEQREATVLLAIYHSRDDIPTTPAEPADDESTNAAKTPIAFGAVPDGFDKLAEANLKAEPSAIPSPDFLASLLGSLNPPQPQTPAPVPPLQSQFDWVLNQFSGSAQPLAPQASAATTLTPDISSILSAIGQQTQQAQPAASAAPAAPAPDLAALLNVLNQQPTPPTQPAPQPQLSAQPPVMAAPSGPANWNLPVAPAVPQFGGSLPYENEDRKRMREQQGSNDDEAHDHPKRQRFGGKGGKGRGAKNANYEPPKFVVQCRYWKEGRCQKGSECTFLHE